MPTPNRPHWLPFSMVLGGTLLTLLTATAGALRAQTTNDTPVIFDDSSDPATPLPNTSSSGMAACDAAPNLFPPGQLKQWGELFSQTVTGVIAGNAQEDRLSCTDNVTIEASAALQALANTLPRWQGKRITENDIEAVLLDYLDTYECTLRTELRNLVSESVDQASSRGRDLDYGQLGSDLWGGREEIRRQAESARESVRRTLTILAGINRMAPLDNIFTCLDRASRDLRNDLGLVAEASQCIPVRTWDARGQLRALPNDPSGAPPPFLQ